LGCMDVVDGACKKYYGQDSKRAKL